jgi:hypothetical protein
MNTEKIPSTIMRAAERIADLVNGRNNESLHIPSHTAFVMVCEIIAEETRVAELEKACKAACDGAEECHYDHHGFCQAHSLQPKGECYVELARAALADPDL